MNRLQAIKQLPVWDGVSEHALDKLIGEAVIIHADSGSVLVEQFKSASDFYLLCEGSIDHYLTLLDDSRQPFAVGTVDAPWSAIGWSGFFEPHRYTTQARCSTSSTLVRWNYATLNLLSDDYPEIYRGMLRLATESSKTLLEKSSHLLKKTPASFDVEKTRDNRCELPFKLKVGPDESFEHLINSTLFQEMNLNDLKYLAEHCWLERYPKDKKIIAEGEQATDVLILIKGTINLFYQKKSSDQNKTTSDKIFIRSLSQPGQIISWASLTQSQRQDITAISHSDVSLCSIPASIIGRRCEIKTDFAIKLYRQLLLVVGSRLRATRALLVKEHSKSEQETVASLLHNIGPQISINSPLHKLPCLLQNRLTQGDVFYYLDRTQQSTSHFERNVAGLCSDLLAETRRDYEFYQGLKLIYHTVVNSEKDEEPQITRNKSAAIFAKVFSKTRYIIKGEEFLPDSPGHIFIMNHLVSHPYHKLPNSFEFSLDTHFVSAMILHKKYGDSGIRVVRKSRNNEYGHESYYQRLGHIYVNTSESETTSGNSNEKLHWRDRFYAEATNHLQCGNNIIICPEGTSNWSSSSPGQFKGGAFRLAAMQSSDTLIVPIVVANFDRHLSETVLAAVVKPPFRISETIDPDNRDEMYSFLNTIRSRYREYLIEAQQLSLEYFNNKVSS